MASIAKAPIASGPELVSKEEPKAKSKNKGTRTLPFDRVTFSKQLELLRAYAAASSQGTKSVTNIEVSGIVGLAPETVSMCNSFLSSVGFIQKGEGGWLVSAEVQSFFRAFDWNKETASHKLAPLVRNSWFAQAIIPKMSFKSLEEEEVIGLLADASAAGPDYKKNLKMLIECTEASGLIERDGNLLRARSVSSTPDSANTPKEPVTENNTQARPVPKVATAFTQMAQGAMRFNVSFDMDLAEMADWRPDRIAAFFSGIAQVLAAKAEVEKAAAT
jgi:hypothetical protein